MKSTATMTEAMKGATRAMMLMNRQVNMPAMQHIMMEFEKQGEIMEMKVQAYCVQHDATLGTQQLTPRPTAYGARHATQQYSRSAAKLLSLVPHTQHRRANKPLVHAPAQMA